MCWVMYQSKQNQQVFPPVTHYLMLDGASTVAQVVSAGQQVQDWAVPLESDVMALLRLMTQRC